MQVSKEVNQANSLPGYLGTKDLSKKEIVCVDEKSSLSDAVSLMKKHHVGNVVVTRTLNSKNKSVSDCMSSGLVTATADDDLFSIIEIMKKKGVGRIPLVDHEGALIGIVTAKTLIQKLMKGMNDLAFASDQQKQNEEISKH